MEALRAPVETISFRFGNRSSKGRPMGVRSRMAHTTSKGANRSTTASNSETWSLKTVSSARPSRLDQFAIRSATPW